MNPLREDVPSEATACTVSRDMGRELRMGRIRPNREIIGNS